jgi:hypothetical protein
MRDDLETYSRRGFDGAVLDESIRKETLRNESIEPVKSRIYM